MNPVILYDSILLRGTLSVTGEASGYAKENLLDMRTYTKWRAAAAGTNYVTVELSSPEDVNCIGIAGHNLWTATATINIQYYDTDLADWVNTIADYVVENDNVYIKAFNLRNASKFRLKIVTASVAPEIAVLYIGKKILFDYPPVTPTVPFTQQISTKMEISEEGHDLGNVVAYKPISVSHTYENLTYTFVITYIKPFWENHASEGKKFFYALDLENRPFDMFYGAVPDTYTYSTPTSLLSYYDSFTLEMRAAK